MEQTETQINADLEEMGLSREIIADLSQEADSLIEDARLDVRMNNIHGEFLAELKEVVLVYLSDDSFINMEMSEDDDIMYCTIYSDHGLYKYVYVKDDDIWYAVLVERDEIDLAYELYHPEAMPPEKVGAIVETH